MSKTKIKKIIINGRFLSQRITGVQRYARELLLELDKTLVSNNVELIIPKDSIDVPNLKKIKTKKIGLFCGILWEQLDFPFYVKRNNGISLNLCNTSPFVSPGIVCIHDVKIKARPQDFSKKFLMWYNLLFLNESKRANRIITVSNFSKKEIIKYYDIDESKITVIPNGWEHFKRIKYDKNALSKYNLIKNNYFFSMSSLEPNKNFKWIAEVAKKHPEYIFAVAGLVNKSVFENGFDFDCPDNMKLLGYISDEESKELMKDCLAFLFPTFYEGFGIPPIEAICSGAKRIIVSNSEIMHEVFGDCVEYIDPYNSNSFSVFLSEKNKEAHSVLKKYSWQKSAVLLKQLIESL